MNSFEGAKVLVTGAASGIGRASALHFAKRGASVGLLGLRTAELESVAEELSAFGVRAVVAEADVTDSELLHSAVAKVADELGGLSCAVAAAGVAIKGTVTDGSEKDWHSNIAVNLTGVYHTARHTMPYLLEHGRSSFIAISSDAGIRGSAGYSAYSASKHGVIGLVRCLALDYGPRGVRSNVVCPSFVETPMADGLLAGDEKFGREFYERRVPLGRFARADEVADAIGHLASNQASYVNGMSYVIDGGTTAGTFGA
ncbi:SDR family NAD(P)-dependent oxidoreductase [Brucella haematophila]|uniref:SDR family NAD(P)-dependent oxidoreductase n=1 Tax=Brucella haematophila TaxID=419474 RepID=UPI00110E414B|nr:SDR family NAD(P)-dependent oxidoreductase [Brucella haematophila]TMV04323.1 SDR family oxidoreductase [Brucella haematophila]